MGLHLHSNKYLACRSLLHIFGSVKIPLLSVVALNFYIQWFPLVIAVDVKKLSGRNFRRKKKYIFVFTTTLVQFIFSFLHWFVFVAMLHVNLHKTKQLQEQD